MTACNETATAARKCGTNGRPVAKTMARAVDNGRIRTNGWTDDSANSEFVGIKIDCDGKVFEFESFHVFYFYVWLNGIAPDFCPKKTGEKDCQIFLAIPYHTSFRQNMPLVLCQTSRGKLLPTVCFVHII
jgi:hypothetical protein